MLPVGNSIGDAGHKAGWLIWLIMVQSEDPDCRPSAPRLLLQRRSGLGMMKVMNNIIIIHQILTPLMTRRHPTGYHAIDVVNLGAPRIHTGLDSGAPCPPPS